MSVVAYFIGGPLDLTKRALASHQSPMFCANPPVLTSSDYLSESECVYAVLTERHRYDAGPQIRGPSSDPVVVFVYRGVEVISRADFKWRLV